MLHLRDGLSFEPLHIDKERWLWERGFLIHTIKGKPGLGIEMRLLDRDKQTPRHKDSLVWLVAETSSRNNRHVTLSENKLNRIMHRHGAAVQHANSSG